MKFIMRSFQGLVDAIKRFPLAFLSLVAETCLLWYLIALDRDPGAFYLKWVFLLMVSTVVGISVEFVIERFNRSLKFKLIAYGISLGLIAVYALIIWPSPEIDYLVGTRSAVTLFALICAALYIPSYKQSFEFNLVALTAFKAIFTSVLYALVLFLGLFATIASIDLLLFNIDEKFYGYTAVLVWVLFMITYFLSLLPDFNSQDEKAIAHRNEQTDYPKLLSILISYIAIPLVTIYSLVLFAYIVKIIVTFIWPIGQLGPMVLAYSMAGLVVYVLASNLSNAFAKIYQRAFPFVWIPIVLTQLISITIRLKAYGITESRYYLTLAALYSLGMAIYLVFIPVRRNHTIALVAMILALLSIIPPIDAFSISRWSQKSRLENILEEAGLLENGLLSPSANVSDEVRKETTSILNYMQQRHYLSDLDFLADDFDLYNDFADVFGFEMAYAYQEESDTFNAFLDYNVIIPLDTYDVMFRYNFYRDSVQGNDPLYNFEINEISYHTSIVRVDTRNYIVQIMDSNNQVIIESAQTYSYVETLRDLSTQPKDQMAIEDMSFEEESEILKMRIIFQNIFIYNDQADYEIYVLIGAK